VLDDRQRIPYPHLAIEQDGYLAGGRVHELLLKGVGLAQGNLNLLELDALLAHQQPRPHRPRRVILVPDYKLQPTHRHDPTRGDPANA
jgi:hypothetical protein